MILSIPIFLIAATNGHSNLRESWGGESREGESREGPAPHMSGIWRAIDNIKPIILGSQLNRLQ